MNPVRAALYSRLSGDATLTGLLSAQAAIYHQIAPQDAAYPLIVFQRQDGRPDWTFGDHMQRDLWTVRAIDRATSASDAEAIADRIDVLLNDAPLVVNGRALLYLRRESDVDFSEQDGADTLRHVGGVYRVVTDPT
jgi:hypothetical protein